MTFKPEVVTNKKGETVAKALSGYWQSLLDGMKDAPNFAISTAYFNPGGFSLLANQLEKAGHVRLMLGAEPAVAAVVTFSANVQKSWALCWIWSLGAFF